jgi:putative peptidoglycan lipid II flippase
MAHTTHPKEPDRYGSPHDLNHFGQVPEQQLFPAVAPVDPTSLEPAVGGVGASVARNALIVGSAFVASRLLGVVREIVIAARFGTSADYDAYVAAFRIPDLLFLIVMSGAFGSAFIPVFGGMFGKGDRDGAWRLAGVIITATLVVLVVASALVLVLAGPLMRWVIAPGLAPEQSELATDLTRLLLLSPLLLGLGIAFKGILEAQERFALAAYAPVFYNLGIIAGAVVLVPAFGIYGLALGVIAGAFLHAGTQFVGLLRGGMRLLLGLDLSTPGVSEVARLVGPRILGQAAFQINFIVMTNFASRIGHNSVSALNYGYQIFTLPYGVLALSLSTVIFPLMARQFAAGQVGEMKQTLSRALAPLIFLSVPASVGLFCFRTSIVQVLFQVGSFDARSTELVAEGLAYFALGLLGFSVTEAVTRAFYAMHDTKTPVTIAVSVVVLNIALSALLAWRIGFGGLALAMALSATFEMVALAIVLRGRIGGLGGALWGSVGRTLLASLLFLPLAYWIGDQLAGVTDPAGGRSLGLYLIFVYGLGVAGLSYVALAYVAGAPELPAMARRIPVFGARVVGFIEPRYRRMNH